MKTQNKTLKAKSQPVDSKPQFMIQNQELAYNLSEKAVDCTLSNFLSNSTDCLGLLHVLTRTWLARVVFALSRRVIFTPVK